MAPSIAETVSHTSDTIQEKLAAISVGNTHQTHEVKHEDATAPAVQAPSNKSRNESFLKLSGALDHVESFDVTPTIGREFVGVNLAKWLRAPNSDELLRDLAITSELTL